MGVAERKLRERLDNRQAILGAAKDLFLTNGFEATTIRNIAEKIEFSPSTIYQYFKDKNEIFYTLHSESFSVFVKLMISTEKYDNPMDQLIDCGKVYIKFALENPELYDLMFIMKAPIDFLAFLQESDWVEGKLAFDYLKTVVEKCMVEGYIKETDLDSLSYLIWSTVHGIVSLYIRNRTLGVGLEKPEEIISSSFKLFSQFLIKS